MNTRLTINLASGIVEAEGSPEFVERIYADLRDTIVRQSAKVGFSRPLETPAEESNGDGDESGGKAKKARRRGKGSGPSCASRIQGLKDEGYFSELRSANDIGAKLREKGTAYEGKHVAASLIDLVKRGLLRRVSEGGAWLYQNP